MIYTVRMTKLETTLQASRSTWEGILSRIPERPRGEDRAATEHIRNAITSALTTDGDTVRVRMSPDASLFVRRFDTP